MGPWDWFDDDATIMYPYLHTASGTKLHAHLCEATWVRDAYRPGVIALTEVDAADWLAADPRRSLCGLCRPPQPHGRLRVVR